MDVGLARLETARRRVPALRAVPPLSKDASSDGFAMAALLTAMSITAIALAAALPAWQQMMQRENEEELVFRGEQYSHAIALFQRKFANSAPPNIDVLVDQRFLRKKYKDPITNDDSVPISIAPQTGGSAAQAGTQAGRAAAQDGAADSEALRVLPMDAARRRQTGAKPRVDDGYGAITRRRTALTRFCTAEASIRCHRENSGVGRGISPSGSRSDQRRDGIDAVPRIH